MYVLKGGMLLAAFGDRSPTRDVDLLAVSMTNDVETIRDQRAGRLRGDPDQCSCETPSRIRCQSVPLRLDVKVGDWQEPTKR